jgi:hypothetical protein
MFREESLLLQDSTVSCALGACRQHNKVLTSAMLDADIEKYPCLQKVFDSRIDHTGTETSIETMEPQTTSTHHAPKHA